MILMTTYHVPSSNLDDITALFIKNFFRYDLREILDEMYPSVLLQYPGCYSCITSACERPFFSFESLQTGL